MAQRTLWENDGSIALEYLRNKRKLSDAVIQQFQFGYCPRYVQHELSGRIIMPLFDSYGNLVVLTTRDPWNSNFSHWHESFDKSAYLFGIHNAKDAIRRNNKAILVEGQFDVTCFHSYGLRMTVGMLGTSFSIIQAIMLSRYCSEVYLLFDNDEAGRLSLKRAMAMYDQYCLDKYNLNFIPTILPDGYDPDDFLIEHNTDGVFGLLKNSRQKVIQEFSS